MPANGQTPPIVVSDQTISAPLWTVIRYAITFVGGLLVASGKITNDQLQTFLGAAGAILPTVIGALVAWINKRKLIAAARSASDRVAVVK